MDKIWFLFIDGKQEGPYSYFDLRKDDRLTPNTYAWREGMDDWKKIREIPELKDLFKKKQTQEEEEGEAPLELTGFDELVLDYGKGPSFFNLWLLIALLLIIYLIYQISL